MRRSGRVCELSGESGELAIHDLGEPRADPSLDEVLHVSPPMKAMLDGGPVNAAALRCLEGAVWSEHPPVREAAIQLLSRVDEQWAKEAVESARMMSGDLDLD